MQVDGNVFRFIKISSIIVGTGKCSFKKIWYPEKETEVKITVLLSSSISKSEKQWTNNNV